MRVYWCGDEEDAGPLSPAAYMAGLQQQLQLPRPPHMAKALLMALPVSAVTLLMQHPEHWIY